MSQPKISSAKVDLISRAAQTIEICDKGSYTVAGECFHIQHTLYDAIAKTVEYPPTAILSPVTCDGEPLTTTFHVVTDGVMTAAKRHVGKDPLILNFASAKNPGGGFERGAVAQEESIALSSGLFPAIKSRDMYKYHATKKNADAGFYTHWIIYTPKVPVFRSDVTLELEPVWYASVLTCPSVNRNCVQAQARDRLDQVRPVMYERAKRVLQVARQHHHATLVLGAWGCGVFGNDPEEIAGIWRELFQGEFKNVFEEVVFAIYARSKRDQNVDAFQRAFGG